MSSEMTEFEKDLVKHKRRLAKKMITYIEFLKDNGINVTPSEGKDKIESIFLCREICAKKWAK
tara:strand:- start:1893 stop:2081 length:189 start_codon:yes stop_codon:yes gene_type:complete